MTDHSCLYEGTIEHIRRSPKRHAFRYRVFSLLLDLDEAEALDARSWMFGFNRAAPLSFRECDHGDGEARGLKKWAAGHVRRAGFSTESLQVRVLCYPRIFGYVFNPLTVYYCFDGNGKWLATLHEVSNTFGEKHTYVLDANGRQSASKRMPVSPFTSMNATYDFDLNEPGDDLRMAIIMRSNGEPVLTARFAGERREMSDAALVMTFLRYPLMTLKVTLSIHFEALRLWLKRVPLVPRVAAEKKISSSRSEFRERDIS
ncbi:MAG: DUF1365 domain-containing protein [Parvibaculum sp.]|nr:DUF1365 domain-containing protein [Parvibaculum sp.]|tara:strand:+ start:8255 stop:9031 length:777 start_codon:yes stop_codon:yes gene_type:complete